MPSRIEFEIEVIDIFRQLATNNAFGPNPPSLDMVMDRALYIAKYMFDSVYSEAPNAYMNRKIDHLVETGRLKWDTEQTPD